MLLEKWHRLTCSKQGCHKPAICKKCIICKVQYKEVCLLFMSPVSTTRNRLNSPSSRFPRKSTKEYWYLEGRDSSCNLKLTGKLLCNHLLIYWKTPCPPLAPPLSSHRHPDWRPPWGTELSCLRASDFICLFMVSRSTAWSWLLLHGLPMKSSEMFQNSTLIPRYCCRLGWKLILEIPLLISEYPQVSCLIYSARR